MPKRFLYLVQSSAERLPPLLALADRPSSDALFVTYDREVPGARFVPGTWGRGRNALTAMARERPPYDYYLFSDDDVAFAKGSYDRFEELLLAIRPAVASPVFIPKTLFTVLGLGRGLLRPPFPCLRRQPMFRSDCQLLALHRTVFEDGLIYPVQEQFDPISPWATSSTVQALTVNLYGRLAIQINPVIVRNLVHRPYTRIARAEPTERWLRDQFRKPVDRPEEYVLNPFSGDGLTRLVKRLRGPLPAKHRLFTEWIRVLAGALAYRPRDDYGFTPEALARILKPESDLYRQYRRLSPRAAALRAASPSR